MSEGKSTKRAELIAEIRGWPLSDYGAEETLDMQQRAADALEDAGTRNAELEAERDAALAVIEQAYTVAMMQSGKAAARILATAPTDALAELKRVIAEKAWDEGNEAGYDDRLFEERGSSTDSDAHEYPHKNPYRANPEPKEGDRG